MEIFARLDGLTIVVLGLVALNLLVILPAVYGYCHYQAETFQRFLTRLEKSSYRVLREIYQVVAACSWVFWIVEGVAHTPNWFWFLAAPVITILPPIAYSMGKSSAMFAKWRRDAENFRRSNSNS